LLSDRRKVAELKKRRVVSADTVAVKVVGAAKLSFALMVLVPTSENTGNHGGNVRTKVFLDGFYGNVGVLGNIVKEGGNNDVGVYVHFSQNLSRGKRVDYVRFTGHAFLPFMRFLRKIIGKRNKCVF
jgi:hypothetical protein